MSDFEHYFSVPRGFNGGSWALYAESAEKAAPVFAEYFNCPVNPSDLRQDSVRFGVGEVDRVHLCTWWLGADPGLHHAVWVYEGKRS